MNDNQQGSDTVGQAMSAPSRLTVPTSLLQAWFDLLRGMLPEPGDGAVFRVEGDHCGVVLVATSTAPSTHLQAAATEALSTRSSVCRKNVFAHPLTSKAELFAVVALEMDVGEAQQGVVLHLMQWAERWLQLLLESSSDAAITTGPETLLQRIISTDSLDAALVQLADHLAEAFDCKQVGVGLRAGSDARLRAMSHGIQFDRRNLSGREREAVMASSAPDGAVWPGADENHPLASLARYAGNHPRLAAPFGSAAFVLLERQPEHYFNDAEREELLRLSELLGPVLALKREQQGLVPPRLKTASRGLYQRLAGPGHHTAKGLTAVLIVLSLFLGLAQGTFRVRADAEIEGLVQRAVVAPFDGFIAEAPRRAGDQVRQGEIIARMEDRELSLELSKSESEEGKLDNEYRKALASADRAESLIVQAQLAQVQASSRLLREKLQRVQLTAPIDGIVISGDLSRALGAPVERGEVLFEVAPLDAYRLVLEVEESDIAHLEAGQQGTLTLTALPRQRIDFVVQRVSPVFLEQDGRVVYRTEATVEGDASLLRPGMEGIAKVDIGDRSYGWILFHRLADWLRLKLWLWQP